MTFHEICTSWKKDMYWGEQHKKGDNILTKSNT